MPIYEFVCMECEAHYEELVAMGASADCPDCGSANVRKQLSVFAAHGVESGPASFGEDADGELYVLTLAGPVYRLLPR